ncbi:MAG: hypothetical protein P4L51_17585 [Puia sp.]|nr:hypothetical protein [Puia sp.]
MKKKSIVRFILGSGILLGPSLAWAQTSISKQEVKNFKGNIESYWKEEDPNFKTSEVPEKWKDESAVIIAQKTTLQVEKELLNPKLKMFERARFKVWLHDKDAVKSYSELYFSKWDNDNGFAARVIKPGGMIEELDLSSAVKEESADNVPERFKSFIETGNLSDRGPGFGVQYYKLAVPDLEPGDIIEYAYSAYGILYIGASLFFEMDPVYYLCNRKYPVVYQYYDFKTNSRCYFSAKSMNGAPEFKEVDDGKWDDFRFEDRDREKIKDRRWVNEYLVLPMVKFQVVYARSGHNAKAELFVGDRDEVKKGVDMEELGKKVRANYKDMVTKAYYASITPGVFAWNDFKARLNKVSDRSTTEEEYIRKIYYIFRHQIGTRYEITDRYFASAFKDYLNDKKIKADLVVTPRNTISRPQDLLFRSELAWLVRVNGKYVFNFSRYSNLDDMDPACQGNEAYLVTDKGDVEKLTLPMTGPDDNKSVYLFQLTLDDKLENITVQGDNGFSGLSKRGVIAPVLYGTNAFREDYKIYGGRDSLEDLDRFSRKDKETMIRKIAEESDRETKEKPDIMKRLLGGDFKNVVSYDNFVLVSNGRTPESPVLRYKEQYVVGDMVKRAGKSLLVSIPSFIGSQFQIEKDEVKRQFDIDTRYARTNHWKIVFTIPAGYSVGDLSALNQSVDNAAGAFISTAKVENGQLIVDAQKIYKRRDVKKEEWDLMRAFLDAAYNFSQQKVVLRKS